MTRTAFFRSSVARYVPNRNSIRMPLFVIVYAFGILSEILSLYRFALPDKEFKTFAVLVRKRRVHETVVRISVKSLRHLLATWFALHPPETLDSAHDLRCDFVHRPGETVSIIAVLMVVPQERFLCADFHKHR